MSLTVPGPQSATISRTVTMWVSLAGGETPLACRLAFDAADPFAVSATFESGAGDVTWVFARDLLRSGLGRRSGEGDIVLEPLLVGGEAQLQWTLRSPSGTAVLTCRSADVTSFLEDSSRLVPPGTESQHIDLDALLRRLLDAGQTSA